MSGEANISVDVFDGLLVDYCRKIGATAVLRGLRAVTDFEFEFQIGLANMDMAPDVETVFLLPWAINIDTLGSFAIIEMFVFIGILMLGWAYAWRKGALEWS